MPFGEILKSAVKLLHMPTKLQSFVIGNANGKQQFTPLKKCKDLIASRYEKQQAQRLKSFGRCNQSVRYHQHAPAARQITQRVSGWARDTQAARIRRDAALNFKSRSVKNAGATLGFIAFGLATVSQDDELEDEDNTDNRSHFIIKTRFSARYPSFGTSDAGLNNIGSCLAEYDFGQFIGKGCNGAVYGAKLKSEFCYSDSGIGADSNCSNDEEEESENLEADYLGSDIDVEDLRAVEGQESVTPSSALAISTKEDDSIEEEEVHLSDGAPCGSVSNHEFRDDRNGGYNLAIKVVFNYDHDPYDRTPQTTQLQCLLQEAVPAKASSCFNHMDPWQNGNKVRMKRLQPHVNIVDMPHVIYGSWPLELLPTAVQEYPEALPPSLNPLTGLGHNSTIFLVMKRYTLTLTQYLTENDASPTVRLMLFAQLLEGVTHLWHHGLAHGDLKADNILLECSSGHSCPQLAIGDFGCSCWMAERVCVGGNRNLMAPEVTRSILGTESDSDLSKADLWAAGALAYEIFGAPASNPFHCRLDSMTYKESDLPPVRTRLPGARGKVVENLVQLMLRVDPAERPTPDEASTILAILLWGPMNWWLPLQGKMPTIEDIITWYRRLSCKCFQQCAAAGGPKGNLLAAECQLLLSFILRFRLCFVQSAIYQIQSLAAISSFTLAVDYSE
ncbi:PREDICTED: serine/threonine-protein kinase PINK1, mitochondrial-like isoform X2 [Priapulus caudatus]|uniref:non-specific serine/threonine protein kinase n=1 Tax=Priapulus caudatus TaxID=37621 RepID=A0ABM1F940_PRICU|nr:PREDICTED: serine/threonine-protein kinase PINK1, mitochondrial-like isoform X2 [Priapulus caudatus]